MNVEAIKKWALSIAAILGLVLYFYVYWFLSIFIIGDWTPLSISSGFIVLFPSLIIFAFAIKFLITKSEEKLRNLAKKMLVVVLISPVLYLLVSMGINQSKFDFNQEKWLKQQENRVFIVDDMLSEVKLVGKSKTDVIEILGEPTETEYFKSPDNVVYYLGPERGPFGIDSEWLVITFDESNMVVDYGIATD